MTSWNVGILSFWECWKRRDRNILKSRLINSWKSSIWDQWEHEMDFWYCGIIETLKPCNFETLEIWNFETLKCFIINERNSRRLHNIPTPTPAPAPLCFVSFMIFSVFWRAPKGFPRVPKCDEAGAHHDEAVFWQRLKYRKRLFIQSFMGFRNVIERSSVQHIEHTGLVWIGRASRSCRKTGVWRLIGFSLNVLV